jgi:hypothetical protein
MLPGSLMTARGKLGRPTIFLGELGSVASQGATRHWHFLSGSKIEHADNNIRRSIPDSPRHHLRLPAFLLTRVCTGFMALEAIETMASARSDPARTDLLQAVPAVQGDHIDIANSH